MNTQAREDASPDAGWELRYWDETGGSISDQALNQLVKEVVKDWRVLAAQIFNVLVSVLKLVVMCLAGSSILMFAYIASIDAGRAGAIFLAGFPVAFLVALLAGYRFGLRNVYRKALERRLYARLELASRRQRLDLPLNIFRPANPTLFRPASQEIWKSHWLRVILKKGKGN